MNRLARLAPLLACALGLPAAAAEPTLPREGWVSWQVPAREDAPAACCWDHWSDTAMNPVACNLDDNSGGYSTRDRETTASLKVYARVSAGRLDRLRVLAANCPVKTRAPVQELADVAADDSARWLMARIQQENDGSAESIGQNAVAALALHPGDLPRAALTRFALEDPRSQTRQWSIFWMAQAAAPEAEATIVRAIRQDASHQVKEHAVFALSQLPEARATRALIAIAEDRSLDREQRRRAVFWLSQSGSDAAQAYLEKVLTAAK